MGIKAEKIDTMTDLKPYEQALCKGIAVIMRREMKKVYDTIDRHFKDFGIDYQFNAVEAELIPDATKDVGELLTLLRNTRPDERTARMWQMSVNSMTKEAVNHTLELCFDDYRGTSGKKATAIKYAIQAINARPNDSRILKLAAAMFELHTSKDCGPSSRPAAAATAALKALTPEDIALLKEISL